MASYQHHSVPKSHNEESRKRDHGSRREERHDKSRDRERRDRDGRRSPDRSDRHKYRDRKVEKRSSPNRRDRRENQEEHRPRASAVANEFPMKSSYKMDFNNRPTLFDLPPPGYTDTSVTEFKALKAAGSLPVMAIPQGSTIILRARRVYVEGLPEDLNEDDFMQLFNKELINRRINIKPGNPALGLDLGLDKTSAYLEIRTAEETNGTIEMKEFRYRNSIIKLSRPANFQETSGYYYGCANVFQDTLNKLFVACIPVYLNDDQVRELLQAFGELKAFNLVKDAATGLSKGYSFCEYRDGAVTDIAISGLNNMQIADKKLVVQRAVLGSRAGTNLGGIIPSVMQVPDVDPDYIIMHDLLVTNVLGFVNMTTESELKNPKIVEEILYDIREECSKYGQVIDVQIPLPEEGKSVNTLGKIFVEFATKEQCKDAHENLAGRKFGDRLVITTFYDPEKFKNREF